MTTGMYNGWYSRARRIQDVEDRAVHHHHYYYYYEYIGIPTALPNSISPCPLCPDMKPAQAMAATTKSVQRRQSPVPLPGSRLVPHNYLPS